MLRSRLGHGGDDLVPGGVAEGVVVYLEAVDVEHADGDGDMQADRLAPLCGTVLLILAPVGDACKLVGHGLLLHLPAVVVQLDMGVDPRLDDQRLEGLCDIVHSAQNEPPLFVRHGGQAGDQNDRDALGDDLLLQFLQQSKTVHSRHHHIQQNEREIFFVGQAQAVLRPLGDGNIVLVLQDGF